MAKIVFGMAVPHSGMLGQAPEDWLKNGERDRNNPELWFRNRTWTYPELEAHRGAAFEKFLTLEERTARAARCRRRSTRWPPPTARAEVDVAIILGKDQKEIFTDLLAVDRHLHRRGGAQRSAAALVSMRPITTSRTSATPKLATYLIESFQREGFDLTDLFAWPDNVWMKPLPDYPVVPHAYSFVYHQIMGDDPPPHVPVIMNCFYPPTQPSMARCIEFGRVLRDAVQAWPEDVRVGSSPRAACRTSSTTRSSTTAS
jgi:hypothetical protein